MSALTTSFGRPQSDEYDPYYDRYISLVKSEDIVFVLEKQTPDTVALFKSASAKTEYRYAPGKWSVKEVLAHVNDTERIMAYRALRISRGDKTPIEGFEQDDYINNATFDDCNLSDLIDEFEHVRRANLLMFRQLNEEAWARRGIASDAEVSVRALAFIMAGHELHHMKLLKEKYL